MKKFLATALICAAMGQSMAAMFVDAAGDCNAPMTTYSNPNVDLRSLEVTDNGIALILTFTTAGPDIQSPNWIKCVLAGRKAGAVNTGLTTGWPRNFNLQGGSNIWVGGWVDGLFGGCQGWSYNGTSFVNNGQSDSYPGMVSSTSGNTVSYVLPFETLGLVAGDTFFFDATTTGGFDGDGAWDPVGTIEGQITAPDQNIQLPGNLAYTLGSSPTMQTISGSFQLNDVNATFAFPRNIQAAIMVGTGVVGSTSVAVNAAGSASFSVGVPSNLAGSASVVLNGASFLKRKVGITLSGSNQTVPGSISLQNGDVDFSGEVDAVDIDMVIASFGSVDNIFSDVDQSGEVDAVDIDIVIANFGGLDD